MQLQIDQCYIEERDSMTMYNWADLTCPAWRFRNGFSMETVSEEISKGFRGLIRICEDGTFQVEDSLCGGPDVGEVKRKRPEMLRSSQPKAECFAMWGRAETRSHRALWVFFPVLLRVCNVATQTWPNAICSSRFNLWNIQVHQNIGSELPKYSHWYLEPLHFLVHFPEFKLMR